MYVKDKMAVDVTTIGAKVSVAEAVDLFTEKKLHRLPVVDGKGKLIGLITASNIAKNTPNNSSSLSIFEINFMLNKIKVEDIMIKEVVTISEDSLLEEAADKMRKKDVGCLVVTDKNIVKGIITHNDIFDSFIDYLGYHQKGTRYTIAISEDKVGVLNNISKCFMDKGISISHLVVDHSDRGIEVVVIATGKNSSKAKEILKKNGYTVTNICDLKGKK